MLPSRWPVRHLLLFLAALGVLVVAARAISGRFVFAGQRARPRDVPAGFRVLTADARDGVAVHALDLPGPPGARTIVHFHNNRDTADAAAELARALHAHGFGVLLVEYRGYGISRGADPSEEGLYNDAEAALDRLASRGVGPAQVVLWGTSLGTGVAAEMARRGRGAALVLVTPYTSIPDVVSDAVPFLPAAILVPQRFDTLLKSSEIRVPTLVIHGDADEVVPFWMGRRLAGAINGAELVRVPGGHHGDLFLRERDRLLHAIEAIARAGWRKLVAVNGLRALARIRDELRLALGLGIDLGSLPAVLAAAYGDRPAIDAPSWPPGLPADRLRSFRALEDDVARLAAAHDALGNARGARVAVAVHNRIDVLLHVLALARAGAVPVPVNPRLKPAELREVLTASRAAVALVDADGAGSLAPGGALPPGVRFCWSGHGDAPPAHATAGGDVAAWLRAHPGARREAERRPPDATALLLCTSGTTGHPKVATLTSAGLLRFPGRLLAAPVGRDRGLRAGRDVLVCALPLAHVMGLGTFLSALTAGVKIVHLERFDAGAVLRRIEADRANVFVGVPTMYADLEGEGAAHHDLGSVQLWVSAADVMPPERARRFQRYGAGGSVLGSNVGTAVFADVYGMVELSGAAAIRLYPPSPVRGVDLPAVAFTLPGFEARVVDDEGRALRWGATGALQLKGPSVLTGYEGAPSAGPLPGGWFPTGDLARLWPGGLFTFMGRGKDRLKVGGFSVFPAEVETLLREHPDVAEVVVVGVPDPRLGERPVALVIPRRASFDAEAFVAWASDRVAGYRRPRQAIVVPSLPRGHHGKINRAEATRLAIAKLAGA